MVSLQHLPSCRKKQHQLVAWDVACVQWLADQVRLRMPPNTVENENHSLYIYIYTRRSISRSVCLPPWSCFAASKEALVYFVRSRREEMFRKINLVALVQKSGVTACQRHKWRPTSISSDTSPASLTRRRCTLPGPLLQRVALRNRV